MQKGALSFTRRAFITALLTPFLAKNGWGEPSLPSSSLPFQKNLPQQKMMCLTAKNTPQTPYATYNDQFPAPLIKIRFGEEVRVQLHNDLEDETALHWRGVRLKSEYDGSILTQAGVSKGDVFTYRFTPPDSGLFLYEASATFGSWPPSLHKRAGLLIVEEREPPSVEKDLIFALHCDDDPLLPSSISINGQASAENISLAPHSRIRIRLVNLSRTKRMNVWFDRIAPLIIALDGQPCSPFSPAHHVIPMGPMARADLICDMTQDPIHPASLNVLSDAHALEVVHLWKYILKPIVTLSPEGPPLPERPPFAGLAHNPSLPQEIHLEKATRARLRLQFESAHNRWTINDRAGAPSSKALISVSAGTPVSLEMINQTKTPLFLHIHGHTVRQLHALDDGWEPYWRDTFLIPAQKTIHCAFVADNKGKWVIESTDPSQTQQGLWTWFEVT